MYNITDWNFVISPLWWLSSFLFFSFVLTFFTFKIVIQTFLQITGPTFFDFKSSYIHLWKMLCCWMFYTVNLLFWQQRMRWLDSITDSMDMNLSKLWKILKEMGIPDHLTCLLRNLYAGQEATVRTGDGTTDWFQIGKGVCQGCILSPWLFNLYAENIMRNAGLEKAQAGIKIARRNINNLRYDTYAYGRKQRRTKEPLD